MEEDLLQEPEEDQPGREVIIIFFVFFEAGLAPLSLGLGWLLGHRPLERFGWSVRDATWGIAAAIPLILMFVAMLRWPVGPLRWSKKFFDTEVAPLLASSTWWEIAMMSVSAAVGEEMLFRGVLQPALSGWLGVPGGLVVTSLLFGLLQPISIVYVVMTTFLGLYLGIESLQIKVAWFVGGNLLMVMVTHAVYYFAALAYLLRIRPAMNAGPDSI